MSSTGRCRPIWNAATCVHYLCSWGVPIQAMARGMLQFISIFPAKIGKNAHLKRLWYTFTLPIIYRDSFPAKKAVLVIFLWNSPLISSKIVLWRLFNERRIEWRKEEDLFREFDNDYWKKAKICDTGSSLMKYRRHIWRAVNWKKIVVSRRIEAVGEKDFHILGSVSMCSWLSLWLKVSLGNTHNMPREYI